MDDEPVRTMKPMKTITVSDDDYQDILLGLDYLKSYGSHSHKEQEYLEELIERVKRQTR